MSRLAQAYHHSSPQPQPIAAFSFAMPVLLFYFDFYSPGTYCLFHRFPQTLAGLSWHVQYRPIVISNPVLQQRAAIEHAAQQNGISLQWPASPLRDSTAWAHIALAASPHGQPGRQICETLLSAIWQHGDNPDDETVQQQAWQAATSLLPHVRERGHPAIKQELERFKQEAATYGFDSKCGLVVLSSLSHARPAVFTENINNLDALRTAVSLHQ